MSSTTATETWAEYFVIYVIGHADISPEANAPLILLLWLAYDGTHYCLHTDGSSLD